MVARVLVADPRRGLLLPLLAVLTRVLGGEKTPLHGELERLLLTFELASSSGNEQRMRDLWSPSREICPRLTGDDRRLSDDLLLSPLPGRTNRGDVVLLSAAWMNLSRPFSGL